jgi:hypothetical protein
MRKVLCQQRQHSRPLARAIFAAQMSKNLLTIMVAGFLSQLGAVTLPIGKIAGIFPLRGLMPCRFDRPGMMRQCADLANDLRQRPDHGTFQIPERLCAETRDE